MKFLKIGYTLPGEKNPDNGSIKQEATAISELLDSGKVDIMHIRKPLWSKETTAALISAIPERLHGKLKLHDHFSLLNKFNLGGVHLNSRNPVPPSNAASVSKSLHTLEELAKYCPDCFDYATLSPIYDSISKKDYKSPFPEDKSVLRPLISGKNIIALGGVTEEKFDELKQAGFYGGAMMGDLWKTE